MTSRAIHWFRQDLRLSDNPALFEACKTGHVLPVFIYDSTSLPKLGSGSKWWLHHSLISLNQSLNGKLKVFAGDTITTLLEVIEESRSTKVFWNRAYSPDNWNLDAKLRQILTDRNIDYQIYNGSLLWEPSKILNQDNLPYRVFTPFYKKVCSSGPEPRLPVGLPDLASIDQIETGVHVNELSLSSANTVVDKLGTNWSIGETNANLNLTNFISQNLANYKTGRDFPALPNVSRLSPHLHFGEISPNQIWHRILALRSLMNGNSDKFLSELGWREFAHYLLWHFPHLPYESLQERFDEFPWSYDDTYLKQWQSGITGYPIVDAGMRELNQTGYMHNRLRMIVGSFLVKNLLIHWHAGRDWFWERLVDADIANNSAGWQWIAGCGADAAPYFRVFNPILQGKKFDPDGLYIKTYIPELKDVPLEYIFSPWEAPQSVLEKAGVVLGKEYPLPIVDLKTSRLKALEAFSYIKIDK
ncbi:MAG: deoxyribodipyrimidine photo-lyase [SAR202 cluster bacterium]|nr:deoxyribodipyrimidine photo-lyase [SAR202 cluster bacterium]